jgi:ATP-binding cassette subfamily B protein
MVVVILSALANAFRSLIFHSMSERIARNLRQDFYNSIVNKDVAFFDERKSGDLLSRLNSDIQVI